MTLQEMLNKYMEKYCLSGAEMSKRSGVHQNHISAIRRHNKYSPQTAKKLTTVLGDACEQYIIYFTCECGKKYIQRSANQRHCSGECSEFFTGRSWGSNKRYGEKRKSKAKQNQPKVNYAEYNERARSQGLSYGQLQGLERLGLR
ncbi:hypothetical protein GH811_18095 [Acetobacterium malicum]|uniref:HTH cro/C1-type domain-containing protein n=1 Tax=Acetobacterium malicum TaxID=52692 RepID=A0ABR6Z275_9FIRM|nr:helix-turn-helix transcriptional regulator [Acetobacterium malicum]MBC3901513.1 hypothetical protein [Acetobacterium malicum]